jgi:hypothetical protein
MTHCCSQLAVQNYFITFSRHEGLKKFYIIKIITKFQENIVCFGWHNSTMKLKTKPSLAAQW